MGVHQWQGSNRDTPNDRIATPDDVYGPIHRYFRFTLDAAASSSNAKCPAYWTEAENGLEQPWPGRVWVNPPYSGIAPWTMKAAAEVQAGHAEVVVMLVPGRVGARWYRDAVAGGASVVIWPRRIAFNGVRVPWDSVLLVYGAGRVPVAGKCVQCGGIFLARRGAKTCSARCRLQAHRNAKSH